MTGRKGFQGHCEICGVHIWKRAQKQRFCGIHTMSIEGYQGERRNRRIAELKKKYGTT